MEKAGLSVSQFLGALRGLHDRFDQRDPELSFFEFHNRINRAAGGSGDGIFQERGMIAGLEHDFGRKAEGEGRHQ
jgi:hypothetical protein